MSDFVTVTMHHADMRNAARVLGIYANRMRTEVEKMKVDGKVPWVDASSAAMILSEAEVIEYISEVFLLAANTDKVEVNCSAIQAISDRSDEHST